MQGHAGFVRELGWSRDLIADRPRLAGCAVPSVSAWSVHQHLEHLALVDDAILAWLTRVRNGSAETTSGRPSLPGYAVLYTGRIPRGRAEAPKTTQPAGAQSADVAREFARLIESAGQLAPVLDLLADSRVTWKHPVLGRLTPAEWLRFACLHHQHHRRIIDDIHAHAEREGDAGS